MNNYKTTEEMAEAFRIITDELCEIFTAKNHDYGNSFFESLDSKGIVAAVVRMEDKMNRLDTLCMTDSKVKEESKCDTLLDLANYAIMTIMWIDREDKRNGYVEEAKDLCNTTLQKIKVDMDNGNFNVDSIEMKNTLEKLSQYLR